MQSCRHRPARHTTAIDESLWELRLAEHRPHRGQSSPLESFPHEIALAHFVILLEGCDQYQPPSVNAEVPANLAISLPGIKRLLDFMHDGRCARINDKTK